MGQWIGAQGWPKVTKISKHDLIVTSPPENPHRKQKTFFLCQLEDLLNP